MTKIISISNQKGGVGKTTTAMNIGAALQVKGRKVLLIDLDPQANLSSYLGYEGGEKPVITDLMMSVVSNQAIDFSQAIHHSESNKLDYVPSNISLSGADLFLLQAISRETVLKRVLKNQAFSSYEYIIIDCLPSLGVLLMNALTASDGLIIPVQTQKFSLDGLDLLLNVFNQIKATLNPALEIMGVLATMADNTNMSRAVIDALVAQFGDLVFENSISKSVEATNSTYARQALVFKSTKLGKEYLSVADEILKKERVK